MKQRTDYYEQIQEQEERTARIMQRLNPPGEQTAKNLDEIKYKTDYPTSPEDRILNMADRVKNLMDNE
jgi:hypothetical protein